MKTRFIAEVSSNHNHDLDRSLAFIDAAASAGCDAVKFQLFRVAELFAPEVLSRSQAHRDRVAWELPLEFLPALVERCRQTGIEFSCTPFYMDAVEQLLPYVDFYKIASYELLWDELLRECAHTGKPIVVSTGMATLDEVGHAVEVMRDAGGEDVSLLHCVSSYPAPAAECNLAAIETMRRAFSCPVGWSDHSVDAGVVTRAVFTWGAEIVEFHFDLEGAGAEYASGHCWLPDEIAALIANVRSGILADGSGTKEPSEDESRERNWRADPVDGLRPMRSIRDTWDE